MHDHYQKPSAWLRETRADYLPRHPLNVTEATRQHWFFEPRVATAVIDALVREAAVPVHLGARLDRSRRVERSGARLTSITLVDGRVFRGRSFIDATYEGDLLAAAGVSYTIGREANSLHGESLNGIRFLAPEQTAGIDPYVRAGDPSSGLLPRVAPRAPGREGDADPGSRPTTSAFASPTCRRTACRSNARGATTRSNMS